MHKTKIIILEYASQNMKIIYNKMKYIHTRNIFKVFHQFIGKMTKRFETTLPSWLNSTKKRYKVVILYNNLKSVATLKKYLYDKKV